jgi:lambda family phage tail tape measure protein
MLTEMLVKMALVKAIGSAIGIFSSTSAATSGAGAAGTLVGSTVTQAKGGGWSGGTQFFANGGAFTNSVVSTPTSFGMANGSTGVMGEAGPEAIMPLTRTSDGSLGVKTVSAASSSVSSSSSGGVNVSVNIANGSTTTSTDSAGTEGFAKDIGAYIDQRYQQLMNRDLNSGGQINQSIKSGGKTA